MKVNPALVIAVIGGTIVGLIPLVASRGTTPPRSIISVPVPEITMIGKIKNLAFKLDDVSMPTHDELTQLCNLSCQHEYRRWNMHVHVDYRTGTLTCDCIKRGKN
jgi:hypothetical protein